MEYRTINDVNAARRHIKNDRYGSPWHRDKNTTRESDQMLNFTFGPMAEQHSQDNLQRCLETAREYEQDIIVVKDNQIQISSDRVSGQHRLIAKKLFSDAWLNEHNQWLDSTNYIAPRVENSRHGEYMEFYTYRHCLFLTEHQGIYDVTTGQRLTNRRNIIERMWKMGFAAVRGRPLSLAKIRWTGEREELEEVTELANRYWDRRRQSDTAKKLVSVYRSINRYAAWPGSW